MSASTAPFRPLLFVLLTLAISGIFLGWNKGRLPLREATTAASASQSPDKEQTAADLALYREMIAAVRGGANYYEAGREKIPAYGFPITSPLNWRLPTYAWLFARMPGLIWVQASLVVLSVLALVLTFMAQSRASGIGYAAVTIFLLFGVVRWSIDGYAYLAQEPWAATLLLLSLAANTLATQTRSNTRSLPLSHSPPLTPSASVRWHCLSVAAGIAALFFRELALPYCGIACLLAGLNRRWWEAAAWAVGIAIFFGFFAWHVGQVRAQLAGTEAATGTGLAQWLRFGGLDFVLLTTRMNSLLFAAPAALLWLYLLASLVGLSRRTDETSQLACVSALAYLLVFAFLGRPENFYWGLLPAPLLAWGTSDGIRFLAFSLTRVPHP